MLESKERDTEEESQVQAEAETAAEPEPTTKDVGKSERKRNWGGKEPIPCGILLSLVYPLPPGGGGLTRGCKGMSRIRYGR